MKALDFNDVASLINKSTTTSVNLTPTQKENGKWALYEGMNKVPNFEYDFYVLYLFSEATQTSMERALQAIRHKDKTQVVYAPSLEKSIRFINQTFTKNCINIQNTKSYFFSYLKDTLNKYVEKLEKLSPKDWVDPTYEVPRGVRRKEPNPLALLMKDDLVGADDLSLLVAEPGQGKTYTTMYLVSSLVKSKKIPIYINSHQWSEMPVNKLESLWQTIAHSFKYFETPISWIDGCEEEFFKTALNLGLFKLIFDGFDEYVLWNKGRVDPIDTIKALRKLADESGAKILLTSRTTFWESLGLNDEDIGMYKMLPFDINVARNYFIKKFVDNEGAINKAVNIFGNLRKMSGGKGGVNFAGRGFVLPLIVDLAEGDFKYTAESGPHMLDWLITNICKREQQRQELPLNDLEQKEAFKELAEELICGHHVDTESLGSILSILNEDLKGDDIGNLVGQNGRRGKLADHPLLEWNIGTDAWEFKSEQIMFYFIAVQLIEYGLKTKGAIHDILDKMSISGIYIDDITGSIADILYSNGGDKNVKSLVQLISAFRDCTLKHHIKGQASHIASIFAGKLSLNATDNITPVGSTKEERRDTLLNLLQSKDIFGLALSGTVRNYDFHGIEFRDCHFDNVTWANCEFDENTRFIKCHMRGGNNPNSKKFGLVRYQECQLDKEAQHLKNLQSIIEGTKKYDGKDLERDMSDVINKFIPKTGVGFKSIHEDNLYKGTFYYSTYKEQIVAALFKYVLKYHHISGGSGRGISIKDEAESSVSYFATNNTFSGELKAAYDEVYKKII